MHSLCAACKDILAPFPHEQTLQVIAREVEAEVVDDLEGHSIDLVKILVGSRSDEVESGISGISGI